MFKLLHSYYFSETYPAEWAAMEKYFAPRCLHHRVHLLSEG